MVKELSHRGRVSHCRAFRRLRLSPETEINLYRIAQEALNNVVKHAKASKVDVMLEFGKRDLVLMIEDNGRGFDQKAVSSGKKKGGLGLIGMRERSTMLGGTLEIRRLDPKEQRHRSRAGQQGQHRRRIAPPPLWHLRTLALKAEIEYHLLTK